MAGEGAGEFSEILLSAAQIGKRVNELAEAIDRDYAGKNPLVIFVMKGALLFVSDLIRLLAADVQIDFMVVSSYGDGTESSGSVRIVADLKTDVRARHVLLVEDIIDSGLTIAKVMEHLRERSPASIHVCALLNKPSRRRIQVNARYVGFDIEDRFVVGYGLDFKERYRGLPYIAVLKPQGA